MNTDKQQDKIEYTLRGRRRIYVDEDHVDRENLFRVLEWAMITHMQNEADMQFLLDYEKGYQPLPRNKTVRPDIDIKVNDNVANQVVVFKCGYVWGNTVLYVHRGNKDMSESDEDTNRKQDLGVTMLNEMNEIEYVQYKQQELARFVEICGLGHMMVDVRPRYNGLSAFELITLDPRNTFCIYRNSAREEVIAGVTFRRTFYGDIYYTVFTPERRYEVLNMVSIVDPVTKERKKINEWRELDRSGDKNPLGMIPIVEFERSPDLT